LTPLNLAHTEAPVDLVMPATAQLVTTAVYGAGAVVFVVLAVWLAFRRKSLMPVLFILGALLTLFLEPVVDVLGNAVHPQIGQYNIVTTNGHPVPWAVFVGYVWYFAALPLIAYDKLVNRTLTSDYVWKTFAGVVVTAAIVEQIPLYFGTWVYYGYQPLKIGFMPVWWIFANTAAVLVPFLILYKLFPVLTGWRQILVVGLIPTGAFMGHSAAGWPMYNALGTDTETFSRIIIQLASVGSVALALLVVWVMMYLADVPGRKAVG
jgi:hypothetical protein